MTSTDFIVETGDTMSGTLTVLSDIITPAIYNLDPNPLEFKTAATTRLSINLTEEIIVSNARLKFNPGSFNLPTGSSTYERDMWYDGGDIQYRDASTTRTLLTTGNAFMQEGNTFGMDATLGTNDAQDLIFETNNVDRMIIDISGNVGFGTPSPLNNIDINTSAADAGISFDGKKAFGGFSGNTLLRLNPSGDYTGGVYIAQDWLTVPDGIKVGTWSATGPGAGNLHVDGVVGIGTTSPAYELDVTGDMRATGRLHIADIYDGTYYLDPNDTNWSVWVAGNIACEGGVHVGSGSVVNDDDLVVDGNTGLGISSPSQRLHVSGNMRLTGAFYDGNNEIGTSGQVLSSTVTGTDWIDAPPQVSFLAYNSGDDAVSMGWVKVEFNNEEHDDGANYDITNDQFTAPTDGVYQFSACITLNNINDGLRVVISLYKNGTRYMDLATGYANTSGSFQSFGGSTTIKLVTDDYVEVYAYVAAGTPTHAGTQRYTNFSGHQIY
jgi:hypothetical protein